MAHENEELRADLSKCIALASDETTDSDLCELDNSNLLEDDSCEVNVEHEPMMFEDYRSQSYRESLVDIELQEELSQFVGKFQILSTNLSKNNSELIEHRSRIHELESTLASLESQHKRGKGLVEEIMKVVTVETRHCDEARTRVEAVKAKLVKYQTMSAAFQKDIDGSCAEIEHIRNSSG